MIGITLSANLYKIATTVDGGWRITFDCGQDSKDQVLALSEHRTGMLQLGIVPIGEEPDPEDGISWDDHNETVR